jgi:hypothetical protein
MLKMGIVSPALRWICPQQESQDAGQLTAGLISKQQLGKAVDSQVAWCTGGLSPCQLPNATCIQGRGHERLHFSAESQGATSVLPYLSCPSPSSAKAATDTAPHSHPSLAGLLWVPELSLRTLARVCALLLSHPGAGSMSDRKSSCDLDPHLGPNLYLGSVPGTLSPSQASLPPSLCLFP